MRKTVFGVTESDVSGWRLYNDIHFSVVSLFSVCSFIRLPKAEGEDCTLGGGKERDRERPEREREERARC